MENKMILTAEEEQDLLRPIDEYVGKIQEKINALRADGTDRIIALNNHIAVVRENANYTKTEKASIIKADKESMAAAKAVEKKNEGASHVQTLIQNLLLDITNKVLEGENKQKDYYRNKKM